MSVKPLAFLGLITLLVACALRSGGSDPIVREGSAAPDFTVTTQDGRLVSLKDFSGSVVFLNFWRTDCVPCAAEMPDMEVVAKAFEGRKFQMMPVSLDMDTDKVARFYRDRHLTMPAYLDPGRHVAPLYDILGVPETFVIDGNGLVAQYYLGPQKWGSPEMLARLDRLIP